jgi:hypothetical protein
MTIIKITLVAAILLFGLILYAVFVPSPTIAGECAYTIEDVTSDLTKTDITAYTILDKPVLIKDIADRLATVGFTVPINTTRIMLATFADGNFDFGLEVDGCLSPPYRWPKGLALPISGA